MKLKTHRTFAGSIFFSKPRNKKTPKLILPKDRTEFLWVEEGLCPQCKLKELSTDHKTVETTCTICKKINIPLI